MGGAGWQATTAVEAQQADPTQRSARAQRNDVLKGEIVRVWHEQEQVYGAEKVWRQLRREQIPAARCTIERLMKVLTLRGVVRGGRFVSTTRADETATSRTSRALLTRAAPDQADKTLA